MICQNTKAMDPDQWLDEGELTELLEIPVLEVEVRVGKKLEDPGTLEVDTGPDRNIPIIPEVPENFS